MKMFEERGFLVPLEGEQKERFDAFMVRHFEYRANRNKVR